MKRTRDAMADAKAAAAGGGENDSGSGGGGGGGESKQPASLGACEWRMPLAPSPGLEDSTITVEVRDHDAGSDRPYQSVQSVFIIGDS